MKTLATFRFTIFILLTFVAIVNAQVMTREEAAVIARAVCDKIGLLGQPLKWHMTQELPTPVEVPEHDSDLQDALALAGYNPQPTLYPYPLMSALPFASTPYDDLNYIYWCGGFMVVVNAYSGKALAERNIPSPGESVLPEDQLKSIAQQFVQAFLGNKPWRWRDQEIPNNPDDLAYFTASTFDPSSGADLLDFVMVTLNPTTGELLSITVYQRTVTISTEPLLECDEARKLGESALQSSFPNSNFITHPEDDLLLVFEDSAREQFLAWRFHFTVVHKTGGGFECFIMIDAHTGQVLWEMGLIPMGMKVSSQKRRNFNLIVLNGREMTFGQPLLLRNGQVYLWTGYLPFLGVKLEGKRLMAKGKRLDLTRVDFVLFGKKEYVALRKVCSIASIRLWWDNERKVPILRAEWLEPKKLLAQKR
ncbi:MAG: hypothetical protein NZ937_08155 [Armatimonadetes bacterium]|nr:hypothetical protein [Armatimonadota bacterium]